MVFPDCHPFMLPLFDGVLVFIIVIPYRSTAIPANSPPLIKPRVTLARDRVAL